MRARWLTWRRFSEHLRSEHALGRYSVALGRQAVKQRLLRQLPRTLVRWRAVSGQLSRGRLGEREGRRRRLRRAWIAVLGVSWERRALLASSSIGRQWQLARSLRRWSSRWRRRRQWQLVRRRGWLARMGTATGRWFRNADAQLMRQRIWRCAAVAAQRNARRNGLRGWAEAAAGCAVRQRLGSLASHMLRHWAAPRLRCWVLTVSQGRSTELRDQLRSNCTSFTAAGMRAWHAYVCVRSTFKRWRRVSREFCRLVCAERSLFRRSRLARGTRCWRRFRLRSSWQQAERTLARRCGNRLTTRHSTRRWQRYLAAATAAAAAEASAVAAATDFACSCRCHVALQRWRTAASTAHFAELSCLAGECRQRSRALERWQRALVGWRRQAALCSLAERWMRRRATRTALAALRAEAALRQLMLPAIAAAREGRLALRVRQGSEPFCRWASAVKRRQLDATHAEARRWRARSALTACLLRHVRRRLSYLTLPPFVPQSAQLLQMYCRWCEALGALAAVPSAPLLLLHTAFIAFEALLLPSLRKQARPALRLRQCHPLFACWAARARPRVRQMCY